MCTVKAKVKVFPNNFITAPAQSHFISYIIPQASLYSLALIQSEFHVAINRSTTEKCLSIATIHIALLEELE